MDLELRGPFWVRTAALRRNANDVALTLKVYL